MLGVGGDAGHDLLDLRVCRIDHLRLHIGIAGRLAGVQGRLLQDGFCLVLDVKIASLVGAVPGDNFRQTVLRRKTGKFFFRHHDDGVDVRIGAGVSFDDGAVQYDGDKAFHADEIVFEFLNGIDVVLQHDLFSL